MTGAVTAATGAGSDAGAPPVGSRVLDTGDDRQARSLLLAARVVLALVLLAHLAVLVRASWRQYSGGNVAMDYAIFHQAWHQIGAGDLNPFSTIVDYPYWRSHLELIMWPLALVGLVFPSGVTLFVLQDLAIVGAEAVALLWVLDAVRKGRTLRPVHLLPVLTALVLFVLNDRIRLAAAGDFHFQPFATFFLLGAARSLWAGRRRRCLPWVVGALLTGDVAGTYVAGLGLSAFVARRDTRLAGLLLMLTGAGWVAFVGLLHANLGSQLAGYTPLVGEPLPAGGAAVVVLVGALLLHPGRPLALLRSKAELFGDTLAGTGLLGLVHPWTSGVMAVVLVAAGLQQNDAFLAPFQTFPAIAFGTAGTALALDWLGRRTRTAPVPARLATAVALVAVAVLSLALRPAAEPGYPQPAGVQGQLDLVADAARPEDQVVASFGIVGRFAGREHVRLFWTPGAVPVSAPRVVFVFSPTIGNVPSTAVQAEAVRTVRALGARVLVDTPDVQAFVWEPPPGTTSVMLPG